MNLNFKYKSHLLFFSWTEIFQFPPTNFRFLYFRYEANLIHQGSIE